jgi:hypothetical protein
MKRDRWKIELRLSIRGFCSTPLKDLDVGEKRCFGEKQRNQTDHVHQSAFLLCVKLANLEYMF